MVKRGSAFNHYPERGAHRAYISFFAFLLLLIHVSPRAVFYALLVCSLQIFNELKCTLFIVVFELVVCCLDTDECARTWRRGVALPYWGAGVNTLTTFRASVAPSNAPSIIVREATFSYTLSMLSQPRSRRRSTEDGIRHASKTKSWRNPCHSLECRQISLESLTPSHC